MSRIAKSVIIIPDGVETIVKNGIVNIKGKLGEHSVKLHPLVKIINKDNVLEFNINTTDNKQTKDAWMQAGTIRSLVANAIIGTTKGWERKLLLVGVGYRAKISDNVINLSLGFSHPVYYVLPQEISAHMPSQTEIVIKGIDKQLVGQVAAEIRANRPPEPYKGKGVRFAEETIARKEAKKK